MKKPLFAVLMIALLSITLLAGCGSSTQSGTEPPAAAKPSETTPPPTEAPVPTELKRISAEEAEAIALKHAGISAENISRIRTEFDYDDGRPEYDIDFYADGWEYEYEIHAETGEILRNQAEPPENRPTPTEPPATEAAATIPAAPASRISEEEARDIALAHAGLTADQVTRLRIEFGYDDGKPEYEVDFYYDGFEYDYDIHAETGKILSWDRDKDD